jgi:hydrogenase maturation protease
MTRTLILALGNPLRADDGIGGKVLEALHSANLPPGVDLIDGGTSGFEIVLMMEGYAHVIVIDAAEMGLQPGAWRRFSTEDVRLQTRDMYLRGTLHYAGFAEAMTLAEAVGIQPERITVFGVQPASIDWEDTISEAVLAAVPPVARAVLDEFRVPV